MPTNRRSSARTSRSKSRIHGCCSRCRCRGTRCARGLKTRSARASSSGCRCRCAAPASRRRFGRSLSAARRSCGSVRARGKPALRLHRSADAHASCPVAHVPESRVASCWPEEEVRPDGCFRRCGRCLSSCHSSDPAYRQVAACARGRPSHESGPCRDRRHRWSAYGPMPAERQASRLRSDDRHRSSVRPNPARSARRCHARSARVRRGERCRRREAAEALQPLHRRPRSDR